MWNQLKISRGSMNGSTLLEKCEMQARQDEEYLRNRVGAFYLTIIDFDYMMSPFISSKFWICNNTRSSSPNNTIVLNLRTFISPKALTWRALDQTCRPGTMTGHVSPTFIEPQGSQVSIRPTESASTSLAWPLAPIQLNLSVCS